MGIGQPEERGTNSTFVPVKAVQLNNAASLSLQPGDQASQNKGNGNKAYSPAEQTNANKGQDVPQQVSSAARAGLQPESVTGVLGSKNLLQLPQNVFSCIISSFDFASFGNFAGVSRGSRSFCMNTAPQNLRGLALQGGLVVEGVTFDRLTRMAAAKYYIKHLSPDLMRSREFQSVYRRWVQDQYWGAQLFADPYYSAYSTTTCDLFSGIIHQGYKDFTSAAEGGDLDACFLRSAVYNSTNQTLRQGLSGTDRLQITEEQNVADAWVLAKAGGCLSALGCHFSRHPFYFPGQKEIGFYLLEQFNKEDFFQHEQELFWQGLCRYFTWQCEREHRAFWLEQVEAILHKMPSPKMPTALLRGYAALIKGYNLVGDCFDREAIRIPEKIAALQKRIGASLTAFEGLLADLGDRATARDLATAASVYMLTASKQADIAEKLKNFQAAITYIEKMLEVLGKEADHEDFAGLAEAHKMAAEVLDTHPDRIKQKEYHHKKEIELREQSLQSLRELLGDNIDNDASDVLVNALQDTIAAYQRIKVCLMNDVQQRAIYSQREAALHDERLHLLGDEVKSYQIMEIADAHRRTAECSQDKAERVKYIRRTAELYEAYLRRVSDQASYPELAGFAERYEQAAEFMPDGEKERYKKRAAELRQRVNMLIQQEEAQNQADSGDWQVN